MGETVDCRPEGAQDVNDITLPVHGDDVSQIIARALPEATFDFYLTIDHMDSNSDLYDVEALIPPINKAVENSVDILNVSAGVDSTAGGIFSYERAVNRATSEGMVIVSAAGNGNSVDRVTYPAKIPGAVAVGGCEISCNTPVSDHATDKRIWAGHENADPHSPYCSGVGCSERIDCNEARKSFEWWPGNVAPSGHKPDVLAPCYFYTIRRNGNRERSLGTSMACPFVTGAIGKAMERMGDSLPRGSDLANLLRETGHYVDDVIEQDFEGYLLDMEEVFASVRSSQTQD